MKIAYRPIPGFPGYQVGSDGTIQTNKNRAKGKAGEMHCWRDLKPCLSSVGYPKVSLSRDNVKYTDHVYRFVALAFLGPPAHKQVVRHLDGNPLNSAASNLAYGTYKDNEADKLRHGRRPAGSDVFGSKLTAADVLEIRELYIGGHTATELARLFSIDVSTACCIVKRQTWAHVGP